MLKAWFPFAIALGLVGCWGDDSADVDMEVDSGSVDSGRDAAPSEPHCEDCSLEAVMPTPGVDCGTQGIGGRDSDVANCVEANLASSTPFHAVLELQGTDSQIALGWVLDETGTLTRFTFDSSICGGSGCEVEGCGPRVSVAICGEPTLIPDEDAGAEQGTELIACGNVDAQPDACGP